MSSIAGLVGVAIVGVRWGGCVCDAGARKPEFDVGIRGEYALRGGEREGEWGGLGDGDGGIFPFPGYAGTGDGAYIGGGTNDAFTLPGPVEPPPTSIAACRSLA